MARTLEFKVAGVKERGNKEGSVFVTIIMTVSESPGPSVILVVPSTHRIKLGGDISDLAYKYQADFERAISVFDSQNAAAQGASVAALISSLEENLVFPE